MFFSDNKEVWKEINRLASAGKWDNLNNMPEVFIRGKDKKDAYAAFQKIVSPLFSPSDYLMKLKSTAFSYEQNPNPLYNSPVHYIRHL